MKLNRRDLFKFAGATLIGSRILGPTRADAQCGGNVDEVFPTSPFILNPFTDPLPIPAPLQPVPVSAFGSQPPNPAEHSVWPGRDSIVSSLPQPLFYHIKLQVSEHRFTTSLVQPISASGGAVTPPPGAPGPQNANPRLLPASTIYGFNGTFPGPMIYARYWQPALVRFENQLHLNPLNRHRGDFGSPEWKFLTHLHNGHTAPESDGNPNHREAGYAPGEYMDNMYLNWPAGGDERECQSFCWFHDHQHDHTGANVYKGMVGLYPLYSKNDEGDETKGWRLPGVPNPQTGRVDYDIPLALYDCALDDGVTKHQDMHNGCGETHPEWWGQTYFRHFPNHGFVGDIFTVNGVAYPVTEVKRRKYRLRFLGASIARCYDLMFMKGTPVPVPGMQGQWRLENAQQCMRPLQIASEGGLLPWPVARDSFEIWPAKRKEFILDFTKYMDGTPTTKGDVIYVVNRMKMLDGRMPTTFDPNHDPAYRVPIMKIVIGDLPPVPDRSLIPTRLRPTPPIPADLGSLTRRHFKLEKSGSGESAWQINGRPFTIGTQLASVPQGAEEIWEIENGGGGWTHPLHIHQEEHRVISRTGRRPPDDYSKEDVVALDPGETVTIFRRFRSFKGKYVAHCHNLAHEDHAMMFGWEII